MIVILGFVWLRLCCEKLVSATPPRKRVKQSFISDCNGITQVSVLRRWYYRSIFFFSCHGRTNQQAFLKSWLHLLMEKVNDEVLFAKSLSEWIGCVLLQQSIFGSHSPASSWICWWQKYMNVCSWRCCVVKWGCGRVCIKKIKNKIS